MSHFDYPDCLEFRALSEQTYLLMRGVRLIYSSPMFVTKTQDSKNKIVEDIKKRLGEATGGLDLVYHIEAKQNGTFGYQISFFISRYQWAIDFALHFSSLDIPQKYSDIIQGLMFGYSAESIDAFLKANNENS